MQRIDTADAEMYWKIALAGPGGTGKTSMGVSAPKPLILLSERQGMPSIRLAAKRMGRPLPPVLLVESVDDYTDAFRALQGPKDKPFKIMQGDTVVLELPVEQWPETVVVDSLTDACDVLREDLRVQSPPRRGRDGLPVDAQRLWGVLIDRTTLLIKRFRDLPMHVIFLCLISDKTKLDDDGNTIERVVTPKLATKDLANTLCAAVNVMAYTYRTVDKRKEAVYGSMTIGPEGVMTKPCEPLRGREVADLSSWIERLNGNLVDVPSMPLPPESMEVQEEKPEPEPKPEPGLETYKCSNCDARVGEEGAICEACEIEQFEGKEAQS